MKLRKKGTDIIKVFTTLHAQALLDSQRGGLFWEEIKEDENDTGNTRKSKKRKPKDSEGDDIRTEDTTPFDANS